MIPIPPDIWYICLLARVEGGFYSVPLPPSPRARVPFRSPRPVGGSPLKVLNITSTWCHEREEYLVAALRHNELNNLLAVSSKKAH